MIKEKRNLGILGIMSNQKVGSEREHIIYSLKGGHVLEKFTIEPGDLE